MAKKVYTIDVASKNLKVSTKPSESNAVKVKEENKEVEKFGIVEINNASATKKLKNTQEKGFEKNISGSTKKSVKAETAKVEDYFDFSFRTNQLVKNMAEKSEKTAESKTIKNTMQKKTAEKKAEVKAEEKTETKTASLKISDELKNKQTENVSNSVKFDNDANQIVRVARIGSLFDCEKRMMNA